MLVVDHYDSYTWNVVHLIADVTGAMPDVVQHDRTSLELAESYDRIVLSPGPGDPKSPTDFAIGREILRAGRVPVLGVCLGMQGLVTAFGGDVDRIRPAHGELAQVRHGAQGIFAGIPSPFSAVRYHSLGVTSMPDDLVVTARCSDSRHGEVVMGVSHRTLPLHGVQFHPESILSQHGVQLISNFLRGAP